MARQIPPVIIPAGGRRAPASSPRPVQYQRAGTAKVAADGTATVALAPAGIDWVISSRSVSASVGGGRVDEYLDSVSDARFLQGTYDGSGDSSSRKLLMQPGQVLYAVWTGATPNAVVTFRAAGLAYPAGVGITAM